MAEVKGRHWPADLPFAGQIISGDKPYVHENGFVCDSRPGDFAFKDFDGHGTIDADKVDHLEFICPRNHKRCDSILVGHKVKPDFGGAPTWRWDGNFEQPTLTPSINCVSGCGWHGHLTAGVFKD